MSLVMLAHITNVVVAGGVAVLINLNTARITTLYGERSPARSILSSVYLSIALTSLFALVFPFYSIAIAKVLFPLQIVYKLSTILTVLRMFHPVVISNFIISLLLIAAMVEIYK